MSLKPKLMVVAMILAALSVNSITVAQQNPSPPQPGQMGGGMMQPGDMNRGNMMQEGTTSGTSGATPQMMEACRGMMQGGSSATNDATKEMLDRCRSMMRQSPPANPPTPDKKN